MRSFGMLVLNQQRCNMIEKKSIFSFVVFLLCILKYYLINVRELFPKYGPENRMISWLIVLPFSMIAIWVSIKIFRKYYRKLSVPAAAINIFLCMPILAYWIFLLIK
jgi:hypothetical protein